MHFVLLTNKINVFLYSYFEEYTNFKQFEAYTK